MPTISVIVPVYRAQAWLPRCIDSILAQTFTDFECILVDDGSPDDSGKICDEYAAKDSRIQVIHQQNAGASAARNAGLARAAGRFIVFCDADDAIVPSLLRYAVQMQGQNPDALVMWRCSRDASDFKAHMHDALVYEACKNVAIVWRAELFRSPCMWLYCGDTIRQGSLLFDTQMGGKEVWGEDAEFNVRYLAAKYPSGEYDVLLTEQPLYFYASDNPNSTTNAGQNSQEKWTQYAPRPAEATRLLAEYQAQMHTVPMQMQQKHQTEFIAHYMRGFAYAVYSARALGEALPPHFFGGDQMNNLLARCKQNKIFSVYYLPFKFKMKRFIAKLYQWDEVKHINYYRTLEIFYRLFFRGWYR